ncbi:MAG: FAD-dependent monooxygenase [Ferruginibacter sp.]
MKDENFYDCAIIGGGLGGLSLAIKLSQQGHAVILFEKETYPFHKVCGEYISMESWNYLEQLGLPLNEMQLPLIKKLIVSAPNGNELKHDLPLGGFGISRYKIDDALKTIALESGVNLLENCKAEDAIFKNDHFEITSSKGNFKSKVCCGSFGKRSNIDIKWKRDFVQRSPNKLNNFIAVKYHIQTSFPADTIVLHNFKKGYCGMSKIEDDKYCLCYLTNAANLKESNNSIDEMERNILSQNQHLKNIFLNCKKLYRTPLSISQISFQQKTAVENNVLMIGDAAGLITPLCGNGMSMAMHAGKIASIYIDEFLNAKISRDQMETNYSKEWKQTFGKRLQTGRIIQRFFGKIWVTNLFVGVMKRLPALTNMIIKKTHGDAF